MFELIVRDGQAESALPALLKVVAQPDTLPCFERTEPPHDLARGEDGMPPVVITAFDRPYTFRVLEVRDDGDAYPTPSGVIPGSFSWKWRVRESAGTPFERLTTPRSPRSRSKRTAIAPATRSRCGSTTGTASRKRPTPA